jgi:DNA-binding CsgD family transcriptional regulator
MIKELRNIIVILILIVSSQAYALSDNAGHISGKLLLNDSWERKIYVSHIKTFEKENTVSNDLIITSANIDSLGNFKIDLNKVPIKWSLLRLHIVKKGVSPNSLIIGSNDENFMFLIAKHDSEIKLYNTKETPIFRNTSLEGAQYMQTFNHIKKLSNYPNSINYENSVIEKEFIKEVVSEKLKLVADTCNNPLVSLYAIYRTDFQSDYLKNPVFYETYLSKWENENSSYFKSFRQKFSPYNNSLTINNSLKYISIVVIITFILLAIVFFYFKKKGQKIKQLSVQERKIFDLIRNGMSNKEISAECNIELTTVKSHVGSIYSKLKIKSRKEALNIKIKA